MATYDYSEHITTDELCRMFDLSRNYVTGTISPHLKREQTYYEDSKVWCKSFFTEDVAEFLVNKMEVRHYHTYRDLLDYSMDTEKTYHLWCELLKSNEDMELYFSIEEEMYKTLSPHGKKLYGYHLLSSNNRQRIEAIPAKDRQRIILNDIRDSIIHKNVKIISFNRFLSETEFNTREMAYRYIYDAHYAIIKLGSLTFLYDDSEYYKILSDSMACPLRIARKLL